MSKHREKKRLKYRKNVKNVKKPAKKRQKY